MDEFEAAFRTFEADQDAIKVRHSYNFLDLCLTQCAGSRGRGEGTGASRVCNSGDLTLIILSAYRVLQSCPLESARARARALYDGKRNGWGDTELIVPSRRSLQGTDAQRRARACTGIARRAEWNREMARERGGGAWERAGGRAQWRGPSGSQCWLVLAAA